MKKYNFNNNNILNEKNEGRIAFWMDQNRWGAVVLGVAMVGGLVTVGLFAPNVLRLFKKNKINKLQEKALSDARRRLLKQGCIKKQSYGQNKFCYEITRKGEAKLMGYNLDTALFNKQNNNVWDGKWRLLLFDYPDREKRVREMIRNTAKSFGFVQFQKNVWIYPFKEAEKLLDYFHLLYGKGKDSLVIITTNRFVGDSILCRHFKL